MNAHPSKARLARSAAWVALLLITLAGCLPIPNVQVDLQVAPPRYRVPLELVRTQYHTVRGVSEVHTPNELDQSAYLRYYLDAEPDTIVVLMPGIFGGAASFDALARQLVASSRRLEVWAVDRRANALEDRSRLLESLIRGDPMIAYRYYIEGWGKPGGYQPLAADEVRYMGFWGLELHLGDLHRIVLEARQRAPTVLLGGHSLGASIVSFYAAYQVNRFGQPRYGHEYVDGLILLDGALGRTGGFRLEDSAVSLGPITIIPSIEDLEQERSSPYATIGFGPRLFIERDVMAVLAFLAPDELAPPAFFDFPVTNFAAVGIMADDEYSAVPILRASVGHAANAEFSGNLLAFLLTGAEGARSRQVVGVAPGAQRVTWDPGDPLLERTDLQEFVRAFVMRETNYTEWYFPLRLALDMAVLDPALEDTPGFLPNREVPLPTLALGAGRGLIPTLDGFRTYANVRFGAPISAFILPGLTHIDIVSARNNPAVPIIQRWAFFLKASLGR